MRFLKFLAKCLLLAAYLPFAFAKWVYDNTPRGADQAEASVDAAADTTEDEIAQVVREVEAALAKSEAPKTLAQRRAEFEASRGQARLDDQAAFRARIAQVAKERAGVKGEPDWGEQQLSGYAPR